MFYLKEFLPLKLMLLLILLFIGVSCSSSQNLITRRANFNPDSYHQPNHYGIKNATEFLKQPEYVIESSNFVPARVEGGINELISNVRYPYEAQRQFQEGQVYMNLFINKKGEVVFVQVLESPDNRLTRYSIYAVKNTDFLAATLNDRPVKSTRLVMFNFNFKLDNEMNY